MKLTSTRSRYILAWQEKKNTSYHNSFQKEILHQLPEKTKQNGWMNRASDDMWMLQELKMLLLAAKSQRLSENKGQRVCS